MGDKKAYLDFGVKSIVEIEGCRVNKVSEYIKNRPYGGEQDDFLNGALQVDALHYL